MRVVRDTIPSDYALPADGRKCKEQQAKRRALAMQLATFADGDGTRIMPGAERLRSALGWSRDTLFWYLNDLKALGFLKDEEGRTGSHGTKKRSLNLDLIHQKVAVRNPPVSQSEIGASESEIESSQSEIGASESEIHPHTTDTLTGTPTDTPTANKKASAVVRQKDNLRRWTPSQLKAARERIVEIFINEEKEAPATTPAHDKAIEKLIENHDEETVGKVLRRDLQEPAFFVGKDGQRTKWPLARFIKRFDRLLMELKSSASSRMTQADIDRTNAVANAAHEDVWAVKDKDSDKPPSIDDF